MMALVLWRQTFNSNIEQTQYERSILAKKVHITFLKVYRCLRLRSYMKSGLVCTSTRQKV